jgi:hypothetical protein
LETVGHLVPKIQTLEPTSMIIGLVVAVVELAPRVLNQQVTEHKSPLTPLEPAAQLAVVTEVLDEQLHGCQLQLPQVSQ